MRRARKAAPYVLVLTACAAPADAGDAAAGKAKATACAACQGQDGNSTNSLWPKLAGPHAFHLAKQPWELRAGKR